MKLDVDLDERAKLYRNLARECEAGRPERQELHRRLRTTYLNGRDSMEPARYNSILEFVDTSSAYLYDAEGARFVQDVAQQDAEAYRKEVEAATDEFQSVWARAYTLTAASLVEYAHVFPSTVAKVFADRRGTKFQMLDDPADLGVWQDNLPELADQECFAHFYTISLPGFRRLAAGVKDAETRTILIRAAEEHATRLPTGSTVLPPAQSRVILASVSPNAIGSASSPAMVSMASPFTQAQVVPMTELWVWDDDLNDFRVATMFRPTETTLWDRANPQPGVPAFHKLSLFPVAGYCWGLSPIERMIALQQWRDDLMAGIDLNARLNLKPPRVFQGWPGLTDERAERLNTPGGHLANQNPGSSVQNVAPPMPPDVWTLVDGVDRMIKRQGGLPPGADVGAEMPGVRAGGQLESMADLGAPRTRKRAMYVEAFLNDVATAIQGVRRLGRVWIVSPETGVKTLLGQLPESLTATVAAHSASPLYSERTFERALLVYQTSQAISDEDLVMLSGLPMQSRLRSSARVIMENKAKNAKAQMELKEAEVSAKVRKSMK